MKATQAPTVVIASYNLSGLVACGRVYCMPLAQLRNAGCERRQVPGALTMQSSGLATRASINVVQRKKAVNLAGALDVAAAAYCRR